MTRSPNARPRATLRAASSLVLALLAACGQRPEGAAPAAASGAAAASGPAPAASAPPVSVVTVRAQQRDLPVLITATGSVAPLSSVDVRAQTTNLLAQVHVKEGQFVKAGQLLFTLDARADEANVAKARAQLARDEAALADAQRQLKRSQELLAQNFVSQGAVDTTLTSAQSQQAAVAASRAALDAARLALSYTRVTAPSAGRLGAINVFPGSAVQANQTSLVTITQLDPITVAFSLPQRHLADALVALKDGGAPVSATLPESGVLAGRLKFVDNSVDASTGTVKVKALFDNKDGKLWPGAFVNVSMTARTLTGAVVVPQAAIIQTARGPIVYTVRDNQAQPRPVQVLQAQGDDAAVSGVKPGERIVLDGRQNLRPGSTVVERPREGGPAASGAGRGGRGASDAGAGGPPAGSKAPSP
ncbi:MAG: efflux RND transporter periplasmic adaptor subunit [Rubrivivax sp.]|nr:efflux RND transporter periplasmic adaptor subunit [Rubrivivax sp.]